MPASLGRMPCNVKLLCTDLISTLLSLTGSRHSPTLSFAFTTTQGPCGMFANLYGGIWYDWLAPFTYKLNILSNSLYLQEITDFIMYPICQYLTCFFIWCPVDAGPKLIWHVCIIIMLICFICLVLLGSVCSATRVVASIFCELNFLLSCGLSITPSVIFNILSSSMSGIPSSAGPSQDITKNLHLAVLSLCLNLTVHSPNCLICNWLFD